MNSMMTDERGIDYRLLVERAIRLPDAVTVHGRRRVAADLLRRETLMNRVLGMSGHLAQEHREILEQYTVNVIDHVVRRCELGDLDEVLAGTMPSRNLISEIAVKSGEGAEVWPEETRSMIGWLLERIAKEAGRSVRSLRSPAY
jgi:hypothetical protein